MIVVKFYIGLDDLHFAKHFKRCFISVNRLDRRKSDYEVNNWIMDSGAFTEISNHGNFRYPVEVYAEKINRWAKCGKLELAVCQDYMCEPFILNITGLTIKDHQRLTIERYDQLIQLTDVTIMPVLQGYEPSEYVNHLYKYGERIKSGVRVGVGSVCKRNINIQSIVNILEAIKNERPDLRLHGFGLKTTSLKSAYVTELLYSADSMAWSYAARRENRNAHNVQEAINFVKK